MAKKPQTKGKLPEELQVADASQKFASTYSPSDFTRQVLSEVHTRFEEMRRMRDQKFHYFNDRKLTEMVDDARKRMNLYLRPREDVEEWQTKYASPTIRNKTFAIIARVTGQRLKRYFFGEDTDDKWRARICAALDEAAAYKNRDLVQSFFEMLFGMVDGTVIGFEGYMAPEVEYWDIDSYDPATGDVKFNRKTMKTWQDVYGEIVPIEEFYPGRLDTLFINGPDGMEDCGREKIYDYKKFQALFGKYRDAGFVKSGAEAKQHPFFKDYVGNHIGNNEVGVRWYFKKPGATPDMMHMIANGVLITLDISPIPWNHKKQNMGLPFWVGGGEPFGQFFYRMPLPFKLKGDSDLSDAIWRMAIDMLYLSLKAPWLSSEAEEIEDKALGPDVVYEVSDINNTKRMDIKGPPPEALEYLRALGTNLNLSSVDNVTQGAAGENVTATEIQAAQEGAMQLVTTFRTFMEWKEHDKGMLRTSNILQFYPMPIQDINGKTVYRKIRVDNVQRIMDGKIGSVQITFVPTKNDLPAAAPIDDATRARLSETYGDDFDEIRVKRSVVNPELEEVYMTARFMRDFKAGIQIIPNSSVVESDRLKWLKEKEWGEYVLTFFADFVDRRKLMRNTGEAIGKNPDEIMKDETEQAGAGAPPGVPPEIAALGAGLDQNAPGTPGPGGPGNLPQRMTAIAAPQPTVVPRQKVKVPLR